VNIVYLLTPLVLEQYCDTSKIHMDIDITPNFFEEISEVRFTRVRVSVRIKVSLVLVIGWV